jgi:hypothetical protein
MNTSAQIDRVPDSLVATRPDNTDHLAGHELLSVRVGHDRARLDVLQCLSVEGMVTFTREGILPFVWVVLTSFEFLPPNHTLLAIGTGDNHSKAPVFSHFYLACTLSNEFGDAFNCIWLGLR